MKSLHHVEQRIFEVEGIRASLSGPVSGHAEYWTNKFNGDKKVTEFRKRFAQRYPDVTVVLYSGIGRVAGGGYLMKNLRATYEFSWIQETLSLYDLAIEQQHDEIEALKSALDEANENADTTQAEPDPYAILGVDHTSSDDEITQAYRRKISRFHPDRLSGLNEAIIELCNERSQMINRARDMIVAERADGTQAKAA